jgi:dTDP-4-dehydrorhamnose reductase
MVLGSTGMLGHIVTAVLNQNSIEVVEANRAGRPTSKCSTAVKFDLEKEPDLNLFFEKNNTDYVVNCIGLIRQLIDDKSQESVRRATNVNTEFPINLARYSNLYNFKVLQIGTDCIFSGDTGNYSELDVHSPVDVYGRTKSLGELASPNLLTLRCSIVGPQIHSKSSLLSWFLSQPRNAIIDGFGNHIWNGLTTLHFARILSGIVSSNSFVSGTYHLVPQGNLSKYSLLTEFGKNFERQDMRIQKVNASVPINRTLSTLHQDFNIKLWRLAGYSIVPTIEQMVSELAEWMKMNPEEGWN